MYNWVSTAVKHRKLSQLNRVKRDRSSKQVYEDDEHANHSVDRQISFRRDDRVSFGHVSDNRMPLQSYKQYSRVSRILEAYSTQRKMSIIPLRRSTDINHGRPHKRMSQFLSTSGFKLDSNAAHIKSSTDSFWDGLCSALYAHKLLGIQGEKNMSSRVRHVEDKYQLAIQVFKLSII